MNLNAFFKKIKIKYQLLMLVGLTILFMCIIQLAYFIKFYKVTETTAEITTSNLLAQLEENMTIHSDSIIQVGNTIAYNEYVQKFMGSENYSLRAEYIKFIENLFDYILISNSNILDIILFDDLDNTTNSLRSFDWDLFNQVRSLYNEPFEKSKGVGRFDVINYNDAYLYVYTLPFSLFQKPKATEICYIIFRNDSLQHIINSVTLPNTSYLYLVNEENIILAANKENMIGHPIDTELQQIIDTIDFQGVIDYQNKQSMIKCQRVSGLTWSLISIVPIRELTRPLDSLRTFSFAFGAIILALLMISYGIIISNITRPINQLSSFMENVSYKTLKSRLPTTGGNEVDQIILDINSMLQQIEALTHKIFSTQSKFYEMELAKRHAEFFSLQNQINPHFLYNTLDCIRSIAFSYNATEIVSISSSMSKIFRYCIKNENFVTFQDELVCVNNYITIIQVRYDGRFNIEQDIENSLLSVKIIKFILQPIIENAVYHGLELKSGRGTLRITAKNLSDDKFIFEIFDTGIGIEPNMLEEINQSFDDPSYNDISKHTGVGLVNINKRIKDMYGEHYGLHVESLYHEWTKVTVLLTYLQDDYE